ncbi:hypothetical protein TUM12370_16140 [Salmonella enterica subsp. enterica serovar Choleraesuis]|nr:hypothetical protein TUM12370_16140 [Salmonella enterica subsp. enterica serovar Choleraesuis]
MIKYTAGPMTIKFPASFDHEGETVELSSSDIRPVYDANYMPGDSPIGFNLSYELSGQGSVVNGITSNMYGEVEVYSGPLNEPDSYEHPDDAPFDTYFAPPAEFTDRISITCR